MKAMDNQRTITKETNFVIYGGGEVGSNCCKRLKEQGYCVLAALDKYKSGEDIIAGLYTYQLGTEPSAWNKSDCVVIVCLADGMIHKTVSDELYASGYSYIVFLPMRHCMDDQQKHQLTRIYNQILQADSMMTNHVIANYAQYALPDTDAEGSVICRSSQCVTVWMRLEMLFSENLELWQGDKNKVHGKAEYQDRNIACANPCQALFDYFGMKISTSEDYFNIWKETKSLEDKKRDLAQREELYRLFKREHEKGMNFFVEGAPEVVWNPKNYCNLVGGHHRTLYLLHEGHGLFPVKMKWNDFEKWHNETVCRKLKEYIHRHKIERFYAPLPNPCFLNFPVAWEDTGDTKLAAVLRYFAHTDMTGMTVLDCSDDEGYFARNMSRVGAGEVLFLNDNTHQTELAALLNQVLYRDEVRIEKAGLADLNGTHRYDVVFALDNSGLRVSKERLKVLGNLCSQCLLMEVTKTEEIERIQTYSGMGNYRCLHKEYRGGQIWELGVYAR